MTWVYKDPARGEGLEREHSYQIQTSGELLPESFNPKVFSKTMREEQHIPEIK